jgi:hypothetical protein
MTILFRTTLCFTGNVIDLTQVTGLRYKVLLRHENILSVQLNTSVAAPGRWTLQTEGADAGTRYNVIVRGTSSLYFNASTTVLTLAPTDGTEQEGKA